MAIRKSSYPQLDEEEVEAREQQVAPKPAHLLDVVIAQRPALLDQPFFTTPRHKPGVSELDLLWGSGPSHW